jgi:hypothetical protein
MSLPSHKRAKLTHFRHRCFPLRQDEICDFPRFAKSFEVDKDDFRGAADAHGWAPGSGAA